MKKLYAPKAGLLLGLLSASSTRMGEVPSLVGGQAVEKGGGCLLVVRQISPGWLGARSEVRLVAVPDACP
jgi:hypothetical protein